MNADQKIALVSVISGGGTAMVAVIVSGLGGWRDRVHRTTLATTDRQQARLAETYVGLLGYAARVGHWAQRVRPLLDTVPPQPAPPMPDFDASAAVMAKVDAYGSPEVRELMAL